jgi:hypothetical protein
MMDIGTQLALAGVSRRARRDGGIHAVEAHLFVSCYSRVKFFVTDIRFERCIGYVVVARRKTIAVYKQ